MLTLTRKKLETIKIGNHISVTVVEIRGDKVRLALEAPKFMPLHRQEVYDAIEREKGTVGPRFKLIDGSLFSDHCFEASVHIGGNGEFEYYLLACNSTAMANVVATALGGTLVPDDDDQGELVDAEFEVKE